MQKNEQENKNASVNVGVIKSDHFYIKSYRAELDTAFRKIEANPKARINTAGIMIVSHRSPEYVYPMHIESYGEVNNIINTLTLALIRKLKEYYKKDREEQEKFLATFMEFLKKPPISNSLMLKRSKSQIQMKSINNIQL